MTAAEDLKSRIRFQIGMVTRESLTDDQLWASSPAEVTRDMRSSFLLGYRAYEAERYGKLIDKIAALVRA